MIKCCTILLLVLLGWSMGPYSAQSAEMTPQEALDIVNEQQRAFGHDAFQPSEVTVRAYDVPENECLQHISTKTRIDKVVRTLKGRRYFLVLYVSPPLEAGGALFDGVVCVFVDRDTRMIILIDQVN
jgi:hypothetical protein